MQDESCEYCNGEIRAKTVTVHYRHKGKLVLIENVPVRVCQRCAVRYPFRNSGMTSVAKRFMSARS